MWCNRAVVLTLLGDISTRNGGSLKLVNIFTYIWIVVSSTEIDINIWLAKAWTAIDKLSIIWKSNYSEIIKCQFFQAAVVSKLLHGCTTWTLTKRIEKKLDVNCTRMLQPILNKSWKQNPTKQQMYGHLSSISKTIQIRRTRHSGHCCRCKNELMSNVFPWTPLHGRASIGGLTKTY